MGSLSGQHPSFGTTERPLPMRTRAAIGFEPARWGEVAGVDRLRAYIRIIGMPCIARDRSRKVNNTDFARKTQAETSALPICGRVFRKLG